MMPKISVCITSYNQKHYLVSAIESVLGQTLTPYEIIIIDDASSDGSQKVILEYASLYPELIQPVLYDSNRGISYVRNEALKRVNGDYITFLDGDDLFFSKKLEYQYKALEKNKKAKIVFTNYEYIDQESHYLKTWITAEDVPEGNIFIWVFARQFPHNSLFRNELVTYSDWKKIGCFDTKINLYEDYEMRIRLCKYLSAIYVDKPLSAYRQHQKGLSQSKKIKHLEATEYIYHKNRNLLDDLPSTEYLYVKHAVSQWIATFARSAAREEINSKNRHDWSSQKQALSFFLKSLKYHPRKFDYKLLLKIVSSSFTFINK